MLVGAALIPDTVLLVPGAAGRADVLGRERDAALDALATLLATAPDLVVVVVPVTRGPGGSPTRGHEVASLGPAGLPDDGLGWPAVPRAPGDDRSPSGGVAAAVGRRALVAAGWRGPTAVLVAGGRDPRALAHEGASVADASARVALLLVGSLSARRGPDGPLPTDDRAPDVEDAVVADLLSLDAPALDRLVAVPAHLAGELAVSAWGPWQVLAGAARGAPLAPGRLLARSAPFGATYVVAAWARA
ncbi:hypothetical protein [Actinotalea solisilvae]|uniref:hypothetical protein n=1 Tax=Actinotalea solisilvae TaxID=2072922 RepID=UPI0018F13A7B|nr:hypothetical protein [Actinotalea solisilvae]